jgi:hypothetical protein
VPFDIDREVALLKLSSMGLGIDRLTPSRRSISRDIKPGFFGIKCFQPYVKEENVKWQTDCLPRNL